MQSKGRSLAAIGRNGYDTANVDRDFSGATLVEDLFRPLFCVESEMRPSIGPHFFWPCFRPPDLTVYGTAPGERNDFGTTA
jgi:hypothetical protein